jgi:hypothetical protein
VGSLVPAGGGQPPAPGRSDLVHGSQPGWHVWRAGAERSGRASGHISDTSQEAIAVLQARLDGAQLAAKLHALRAGEAQRQVQEERQRTEPVREEVEFLRAQLVPARDAEREFRVLLAQTTRALEAVTEPPALPEQNITPKRPWWRLGTRR